MATITGSKYSGTISSYTTSTRQVVVTGATFVSGNFSTSRMIVAYNGSDEFIGLAMVRRYVNGTTLELESNFFDPITQQEVTVTSGGFEVSNNLSESGGWSVSSQSATQSGNHNIGTGGNERSVCIYDEGKVIESDRLDFFGGVMMLGRPNSFGKSFTNPCTSRHTVGGIQMITRNASAHFFMIGGSIISQATPAYYGGYGGSAAGSFLLQEVNTGSSDLISVGAGGSWGLNANRQLLRNVKTLAGSNNAISIRWGDGSIEGGSFQLVGSIALSIFGSDTSGTYNIGANAGERATVQEVGIGSKPALFRSSGAISATVNFDNLVSPDRRFSNGGGTTSNNNATGIFTYTDLYSNGINGTKIYINNSSGSVVDSGTSNGVDGVSITVEEARVTGASETVTESNWTWGTIEYTQGILSGSFSTSTQSTIGGDAKNVEHGAILLQQDDLSITETTKTTVDAYSTIDSAAQLYDRAKADLFDNFAGETQTTVIKSGENIDARALNVVLDATAAQAFSLSGSTLTIKSSEYIGNITTTGTITLSNGATFIGTFTDSVGTTTVAPLSVTVVDAGGTPIQDARVFIRPSGGGSAILTGLTNSSGVLTGSYTGATPQAIEGWVRKSTSPATLYKQFAIAGTITSSGFSVTALMTEDE
jgi:hypothetical protein